MNAVEIEEAKIYKYSYLKLFCYVRFTSIMTTN